MTKEKAKWMLACAVAQYQKGSQLLRTYEKVLSEEEINKIKATRENFRKVGAAMTERLYHETLA